MNGNGNGQERTRVFLTDDGKDYAGPPEPLHLWRVEMTLDRNPNLTLTVNNVTAPDSGKAVGVAAEQIRGVLRKDHTVSHFHVVQLDGEAERT